MTNKVVVRKMTDEDLEDVLEIEHASFATPWSRDSFNHELHDNPYAAYYVIVLDDQIVGYCGLWVIIDEAHITNIAILPEFRGYRLGKTLFQYVLQEAKRIGSVQLSLEVRVSNVTAQKMYRQFGLVPGGIRKNYYTDNQEDALVMWVKL